MYNCFNLYWNYKKRQKTKIISEKCIISNVKLKLTQGQKYTVVPHTHQVYIALLIIQKKNRIRSYCCYETILISTSVNMNITSAYLRTHVLPYSLTSSIKLETEILYGTESSKTNRKITNYKGALLRPEGASIASNCSWLPWGVMPGARRNTFTSPFWNGPALLVIL